MRFLPEQRLRHAADFTRVRKDGVYHDCGVFILQLSLSTKPNPARPRLGLVVSRRVGNAVTRNRVKRLFREVFRENQTMLPSNADVVFIARKGMDGISFETVEAQFRQCLKHMEKRLVKLQEKSAE